MNKAFGVFFAGIVVCMVAFPLLMASGYGVTRIQMINDSSGVIYAINLPGRVMSGVAWSVGLTMMFVSAILIFGNEFNLYGTRWNPKKPS